MLKVDRICVWLFIIGYCLLIFSLELVKFIDEVILYSMLGVVLVDCVVNRSWRRYRLLLTVAGVLAAYALYSMTCVHFNTKAAVIVGLILEFKPYIAVLVMLCVAPELTAGDKRILRTVSLVYGALALVSLVSLDTMVSAVFSHPAYYGGTCLLASMVYAYCSMDDEGRLSDKTLLIMFVIMAAGIASGRSKYYGEFIVAFVLFAFYRPGMLRRMSVGTMAGLAVVAVIFVAAVWQKFSFYFITGGSGVFDINNLDSFARAALYAGMVLVLIDFPLFGSGLASFASFASASPYSTLYERYGLNHVWGLSESMPDFISDAYYASLAQFGIVGIVLFVWFWVHVYRCLRVLTKYEDGRYKYLFAIGSTLIATLLIELTTGTMIFQPHGEYMMMVLGLVCITGKRLIAARRQGAVPDAAAKPPALPERIR